MQKQPSPGFSLIMRLEIKNQPGMLARVLTAIGSVGGDMDNVDIVGFNRGSVIRELVINARDEDHEHLIAKQVKNLDGVKIVGVYDNIFALHRGGKLDVKSRIALEDQRDLSRAYTPGVARISMAIHRDPSLAAQLTMKQNMVAVVTDGSAVLGLGNIGPAAALPVMEGKAVLFNRFGGVNAFPICLNTQDPDKIIDIVKNLSPGFGGINLEDISAPRCFYIEETLKKDLDIPVFHDDQHGTAVVVLAALYNALSLVKKRMGKLRTVINGAGAAGIACARILMEAGVKDIILCDTHGAIYRGRKDNMNDVKRKMAALTNPRKVKGALTEALKNADFFLGVSGPNVLTAPDVKAMAPRPIVFALSNPVPEISPEEIYDVPGLVMATGRSDYPNQINNVLCFPGIFRGALDCHASEINLAMKLAAAKAISETVRPDLLSHDYIIPSVFNPHVVSAVVKGVIAAAKKTGVARKIKNEMHGRWH